MCVDLPVKKSIKTCIAPFLCREPPVVLLTHRELVPVETAVEEREAFVVRAKRRENKKGRRK